MERPLSGWFIGLALLVSSSVAHAGYSNLFVFGDSLSDSGNNAAVFSPGQVTPVPIPANSFIPTFPYASGHYTNAQVWAQIFAPSLGLSANPSLAGGTDYAFGGATTGPLSPNLLSPFPPTLETQVGFFLTQHGNAAPSDALYVVAGGGNDARGALVNIAACGGVPSCIIAAIASAATTFATNIETIVQGLELAGARHIVVWNTPDLGKAPAILAMGTPASMIATELTFDMNAALIAAIGGDSDIQFFDLFGLLDGVAGNPAAFGLSNVTDACAALMSCNPSTYLFWDGIHPTSAGAQIISNAMVRLVPEPATLALLGVGLAGLGFSRRRKWLAWSRHGSEPRARVTRARIRAT